MAAAQGGDEVALDALLRRHHDRVYALCRRMAGNDSDAADASQEALIALVRGLHRYDGRAAFTTWLHRVTTNACIDELRRRGRRPEPGLPEHERAPAGAAPDGVERLVDRLTLDEALGQLPENQRLVITLRDQLGLDYEEIAEVAGIPIGTVRSRLFRGRAALAALLGGNRGPSTTVQAREP